MDALERIAEAVLYEGYVLWPYRRSAHKNQQRWTLGGVYPRAFCETTRAGDAWHVQTQCLVTGEAPVVTVELRYLQLVERRPARLTPSGELVYVDELQVDQERILAWDEAVERRVAVPGRIAFGASEARDDVEGGVIVRRYAPLAGEAAVRIEALQAGLSRVTARLENTSPWSGTDRAAAQHHTFLSAHFVLRVSGGDFVSATDPPPAFDEPVAALNNVGLWPVLVGDEGEHHTILASPIILYDYPRIAPESPQLLFDSGEIDQLLLLNTLTLSDAEKAEIRATDPRTRDILDRAEALTAADVGNLHGAFRDFRVLRDETDHLQAERLMGMERPTPGAVFVNAVAVRPGSRVSLHPRAGADIFDLALAGRTATVESIQQDYDDRVQLAVVLDDDPGADLGTLRLPGHRFFFSPEEVEPLL